jgi:hypothetical protein
MGFLGGIWQLSPHFFFESLDFSFFNNFAMCGLWKAKDGYYSLQVLLKKSETLWVWLNWDLLALQNRI